MKKHYSQMTNDETTAILNAVRSNNYTTKAHADDRMREKRVNDFQIAALLSYGKVIEVHNDVNNEIRVLIGGLVGGRRCKAVFSLTTKKLVTCWWNNFDDTHRTLDKSQYQWQINLKTVI